ncbi:hypothetical protein [Nocardia brasiliensis]|uniref:hypothetical protein n=1 Tax=Nocardia brasiliensis TaxID=37326 RepID=UPI001894561C|nr:hypothetical protein [Nocardia brasiliensis]MBF6543134.1 hypothetical protein [Nocardia brasiliensis]
MRNPVASMARVRGAFVGSASGAVSIAAHAVGGGTVSSTQSPIVLLIAACAGFGVLVGVRRNRYGVAEIMVLLAIGQAVGHLALTVAPGHQHSAGMSSVMLGAHLAAIPFGAALIRGAELAVVRAVSAANRAVRVLDAAATPPFELAYAIPLGSLTAPRRLLRSSGFGRRGPPHTL